MKAAPKKRSKTVNRLTATSRGLGSNGTKKKTKKKATRKRDDTPVKIDIPILEMKEIKVKLVGDRPLLVNNKLNIGRAIAEKYSGTGKSGHVELEKFTPAQQYARAFYVLPESKYDPPDKRGRYGVPTSGLQKCMCTAIRTTGISNNTTVGLISRSFTVMADDGGLCEIKWKRFQMDERLVQPPKGVMQIRYRPIFHGWSSIVRITYNPKVMGPNQIINLLMHAGQFVGLCEMRAEKKQGECGGFVVEDVDAGK